MKTYGKQNLNLLILKTNLNKISQQTNNFESFLFFKGLILPYKTFPSFPFD